MLPSCSKMIAPGLSPRAIRATIRFASRILRIKPTGRPANHAQTQGGGDLENKWIGQAQRRPEAGRFGPPCFLNGAVRALEFISQSSSSEKIRHVAMRIGMVFEQVAFLDDAGRHIRVSVNTFANAKKRGGNFALAQQVQ